MYYCLTKHVLMSIKILQKLNQELLFNIKYLHRHSYLFWPNNHVIWSVWIQKWEVFQNFYFSNDPMPFYIFNMRICTFVGCLMRRNNDATSSRIWGLQKLWNGDGAFVCTLFSTTICYVEVYRPDGRKLWLFVQFWKSFMHASALQKCVYKETDSLRDVRRKTAAAAAASVVCKTQSALRWCSERALELNRNPRCCCWPENKLYAFMCRVAVPFSLQYAHARLPNTMRLQH